jgi:hypothetical protein
MAWSYANAPGTSTAAQRRDAVRLEVGDTDSTQDAALTLTDEEIAYYLAQNGNSISGASIAAAGALHSRFARLPDTQVVGVGSVSAGEVAKNLEAVITRLTADASKGAAPVFGGQSIAANRRLNAKIDVPQPTFLRDGDSYPGSRTSP